MIADPREGRAGFTKFDCLGRSLEAFDDGRGRFLGFLPGHASGHLCTARNFAADEFGVAGRQSFACRGRVKQVSSPLRRASLPRRGGQLRCARAGVAAARRLPRFRLPGRRPGYLRLPTERSGQTRSRSPRRRPRPARPRRPPDPAPLAARLREPRRRMSFRRSGRAAQRLRASRCPASRAGFRTRIPPKTPAW